MFNHLHVHTEYSPLDGLSKIEDLIIRAKELGQTAMAITDHGSTSGLYEASKLSKKHDFKILYGSEFYFENVGESRKAGHLILIAKNNQGLANLFKLQAMAYMDNFYYKPRLNLSMLSSNSEGLICLSACLANQIAQYVLADENVLALSHLCELKKIFGDDFYLELQSSTMPEQITVNTKYVDWIKDGLAKPIITNDVHYTNKNDWFSHEVMLAIQQNKKMSDTNRWKFTAHDYWLKSEEEIIAELTYLDQNVIQCGLNNIQEIIDKCNVNFEAQGSLPKFLNMSREEENIALEKLVISEYTNKIKSRGEDNPEFFRDLLKEIEVIEQTGYSGYFLIVWEYVNWAKQNGILVGDGRGSGAGSKVAYTIGITEINPQKYDLLFERFLSPGREPDFDIDFSNIDAVFKHIQDIYGKTNVARVGAFSMFTAKSATRKVLSTFGQTQSEINKVVSFMPNRLSFTMEEALKENKDLKKYFNEHFDWLLVIQDLENVMDHLSTHAGGVIIGDNLIEKLPIINDRNDESKLIVAMDKETIAELNYYKFDILGLSSLTLLQRTLDSINKKDGLYNIDKEDQNIYNMLCEGNVLGVFQLSEQKNKVVEQQPRCFEDLIAINALIRPGVGDWNEYIKRRRVGYTNNTSVKFLDNTSGIIVYQEQYLLLASLYAGWDIAYSDKHIRKNEDIINDKQLREQFYKESAERGYEAYEIQDVWEDICNVVASGYGFNRSHSTSYASLTYQTAWLKYYYPKEFYASLLTMESADKNEVANILCELKKLNIPILYPDINKSTIEYVPTSEGILMPLNSIEVVGGSAIYEINKLRPITSLQDLLERRTQKFIRNNAILNLIKAHCFEFEGKTVRESMAEFFEKYPSLVDSLDKPQFAYDAEAFGLYIRETPYEKYGTTDFREYPDNSYLVTIAEVTEIVERKDKNQNDMAFITAINKHGKFKVIAFSKLWSDKKIKEFLTLNNLVVLKGRKDKDSLLLNEVEEIE